MDSLTELGTGMLLLAVLAALVLVWLLRKHF